MTGKFVAHTPMSASSTPTCGDGRLLEEQLRGEQEHLIPETFSRLLRPNISGIATVTVMDRGYRFTREHSIHDFVHDPQLAVHDPLARCLMVMGPGDSLVDENLCPAPNPVPADGRTKLTCLEANLSRLGMFKLDILIEV